MSGFVHLGCAPLSKIVVAKRRRWYARKIGNERDIPSAVTGQDDWPTISACERGSDPIDYIRRDSPLGIICSSGL